MIAHTGAELNPPKEPLGRVALRYLLIYNVSPADIQKNQTANHVKSVFSGKFLTIFQKFVVIPNSEFARNETLREKYQISETAILTRDAI